MASYDFSACKNQNDAVLESPETLDLVITSEDGYHSFGSRSSEGSVDSSAVEQLDANLFDTQQEIGRNFSFSSLGKFSLFAISVILAAKVGLALDRNLLTFSSEKNILPALQSFSVSEGDGSRKGGADAAETDDPHGDELFARSIVWLPQSMTGLRYAGLQQQSTVQSEPFDAAEAVDELLHMNLKMDSSGQQLARVRFVSGVSDPEKNEKPWLDIDPEMLMVVAGIPDFQPVVSDGEESPRSATKNAVFSQADVAGMVVLP